LKINTITLKRIIKKKVFLFTSIGVVLVTEVHEGMKQKTPLNALLIKALGV